jgi:hypothetical protein
MIEHRYARALGAFRSRPGTKLTDTGYLGFRLAVMVTRQRVPFEELPDFIITRAVAKGHPCPHRYPMVLGRAACRFDCGSAIEISYSKPDDLDEL